MRWIEDFLRCRRMNIFISAMRVITFLGEVDSFEEKKNDASLKEIALGDSVLAKLDSRPS